MSNASYLASTVAIAVLGSLVGAVAYLITGESFWIGAGAAIAMAGWLALGASPPSDDTTTLNRRIVFGIAVAAGVTAGLALTAATGWGFWIGVGLSAGLLVGWIVYTRR